MSNNFHETGRGNRAVVIGASAGGLSALKILLADLPADFAMPIMVVQHVGPAATGVWITFLDAACKLTVKEADEKEKIEQGTVYVAPANYHLLIERDYTFSLSADRRVNFARPSIDVLFESAAYVYESGLIGLVLTGANSDGAYGLKKIKEMGGIAIVQDPDTAESSYMPASAIEAVPVDHILPLEGIRELLLKMAVNKPSPYEKHIR